MRVKKSDSNTIKNLEYAIPLNKTINAGIILLFLILIGNVLCSANINYYEGKWTEQCVVLFCSLFFAAFYILGVLTRWSTTADNKRYIFLCFRLCLYVELLINLNHILKGEKCSFDLLAGINISACFFVMAIDLFLLEVLGRYHIWFVLTGTIIMAMISFSIPILDKYTALELVIVTFPVVYVGNKFKLEKKQLRLILLIALIILGTALCCIDLRGRVIGIGDFSNIIAYSAKSRFLYMVSLSYGGALAFLLLEISPLKRHKFFQRLCERILPVVLLLIISAFTFRYLLFLQGENFIAAALIIVLFISGIFIILLNHIPLKYFGGNSITEDYLFRFNQFAVSFDEHWATYNKAKKIRRFTAVYTMLFLGISFLVFMPFIQNEKSLIWNPDGISAYYGNLVYLRNAFTKFVNGITGTDAFSFSTFDFSVSLGRDVSQRLISTLFTPIQLIACFCPLEYMEILYGIGILARYYLSGITFSRFALEFDKKPSSVLGGTFVYVFCGFAVFSGVRHPHFIGMMAFFPLLLLGIEKVLHKKKSLFLTGIVFWGTIWGIYTFYIMTLVAVIYTIIRFFQIYHTHRLYNVFSRLAVCIGSYFWGVMMGAVTWIPTMMVYTASGRIGDTKTITWDTIISYDAEYYNDLVKYFVSGKMTIGSWTCLGFSVIVIPMIVLLFCQKDKRYSWLKKLFITFSILLLIPLFAYAASGFSNISNRWCFAYAFILAFIVVVQLDKLEYINHSCIYLVVGVVIGYSALLLWCNEFPVENRILYTLVLLLVLLADLLCMYISKRSELKQFFRYGCIFISTLSIIINANFVYSAFGDNYVSTFFNSGEGLLQFSESALKSASSYLHTIEDDSFYRVGCTEVTLYTDNSASLLDVYGLSDFNSAEAIYNNYLIETENSGLYDTTVRLGMDHRAMQLALSSVKYYAVDGNNLGLVPYGYELVQALPCTNGTTDYVYKNNYALPLGFSYDTYLTRDAYEALSALERQEAVLQAALVEKDLVMLEDSQLSFTSLQQNVTDIQLKNAIWENDKLSVGSGGGYLTLYFEDSVPNSEVYVRFVGHDVADDNTLSSWRIYASAENVNTSTVMTSSFNTYTTQIEGRLLNLGYHDTPISSINLYFPNSGDYYLQDCQIWSQPMELFPRQIDKLSEDILDNVVMNGNTIEGEISLTEQKLLCLTIPYSSINGWDIYVDGNQGELLQVNTLYMGIVLEPGLHTIRLVYHSPGVTLCMCISLISITLYLIANYLLKHSKSKKLLPANRTRKDFQGF